jgi:hypothetical protein
VVVGIAIVPAQRRIWYAIRGQGAFIADIEAGQLVRERPLRVGGSVGRRLVGACGAAGRLRGTGPGSAGRWEGLGLTARAALNDW